MAAARAFVRPSNRMPVPGSALCNSPAGTAACASSHRKVIQVTARPYGIWHNCSIMSVGTKSQILDASDALKASLSELGTKRYFSPDSTLFREDGNCVGVFLVITGKVRLSVRSLPRLDRVFSGGSLLGLPSTFTGHPYSLTATVVADAEIVHVTQEEFVGLDARTTGTLPGSDGDVGKGSNLHPVGAGPTAKRSRHQQVSLDDGLKRCVSRPFR